MQYTSSKYYDFDQYASVNIILLFSLVSAAKIKKCPFMKDENDGMQALNLAVAANLSLNGECGYCFSKKVQ